MASVLGTADLWPVLLGLTILPTVFQLIALPFCPESPKYTLLNQGKEIEAQRGKLANVWLIKLAPAKEDKQVINYSQLGLTWLRGTIEVHDEMDEMRAEYEAMKLVPKTTLKEMMTNNSLRAPLIIAVAMMLAQQLSGINAVSHSQHSQPHPQK